MARRTEIICSHLPRCRVFADVGCDHGYMAQYALRQGLCERAYITDISAESLKKAESHLRREIERGVCIPVCTDGLKGLPETPDCVLIAGMGGAEIVRILEGSGIPEAFVLQPMANPEKVRVFLSRHGCLVTEDYTFRDGRWYDLIAGRRTGGEPYTEFEILFGRGNLRVPSEAFLSKLKKEEKKLRRQLTVPALSAKNREKLRQRLTVLEAVTDAIEEDL